MVSLAPNLTEMVFDAGGGGLLVARTQFCDHPPEVLSLPVVSGGVNPDLESILEFKPDLVLSLQFSAAALPVEKLRDAGISVYWTRVETAQDVIRTVRELGELAGTTGAAEEKALALEKEVEHLAKWSSDAKVLMVHGHRPIVCAGEGSWGNEMLKLAGFRNALAGSSARYPALDMEQILDAAPRLVVDTDFTDSGNDLDTFWGQFAAPGSPRPFDVVFISDSILLRPGPRMVHAALLLRERLREALAPPEAGMRPASGRR